MFERRLHFHIDWALVIALMALCLIGLANIYSATGGPTSIYVTQIYGIVLGLIALTICLAIDYRTLADKPRSVYGGVVLRLVYVLFLGVVRGGSRRWIDLGPLNLQPSEFAKAALALVLAKFFDESPPGGPAPGPRYGRHARPRALRHRLPGGHADAHLRHPRAGRRARGARRVEVRAP